MAHTNITDGERTFGNQGIDEVDPDLLLLGDDDAEKEQQVQVSLISSETPISKTVLFESDNIKSLTDGGIAKFLYSKGGHRGKAMAALSESLAWRMTFQMTTLLEESFTDLEESGKLQFWGSAMDGSAILIWTGSRHVLPRTEQDLEREVRFLIYTIERAISNGRLADRITLIVDRQGMRTDKADLKIISRLVPILQNHYPDRLSRMYIFPTNTLFRVMWTMTSGYLDPATASKIRIRESPAPLAEWVTRDNLFVRYGGLGADPYEAHQTHISGPTALTEHAVSANPYTDQRCKFQGADRSSDSTRTAQNNCGTENRVDGQDAFIQPISDASLAASCADTQKHTTIIGKSMVTIESVWEAPIEYHQV
ncbi:hypothetical protein BASA50_009421 [Batrachochytrium salamandrivorans]|uniref:CRAL-TRIO domain-containing protein n=1 Tax=Batrachochytrium salamandrivorans TaxID=1357716 RepID=A0ABQ8F1L9_9FUNG|nr:hypothetical protein BASA50_009421 [Batrachochytrium salamandrivorans]KAJ1344583.1 hypothetical protein BSLG_000106 [Batrachochytrium salamandrivorans]